MKSTILALAALCAALTTAKPVDKRAVITTIQWATVTVTVTGSGPEPTSTSAVSAVAAAAVDPAVTASTSLSSNSAWSAGSAWSSNDSWSVSSGNWRDGWRGGWSGSSGTSAAAAASAATTLTAAAGTVTHLHSQTVATTITSDVETTTSATTADETVDSSTSTSTRISTSTRSSTNIAQATSSETETTTSSASSSTSTTSSSYESSILESHNIHRRNASVADLVWSDDMATIAAEIAASCVYAHDTSTGGGGYGQNIGAGSPPSGVPAMITNEMYNDEIGWYPLPYGQANPDMTNFEHWGHYSQIVWKSTTSVGCATQYCPNGLANTGSGVSPYFTVCNYSPPGNYGGEYGDNVLQPGGEATVTY
ncbi:hypothetical protein PV11_02133 [Exophiala sideris]|uniref:SCP domain-containing protein n=1 Tax=Exophiala sideris TaxID=1016849 RepID=A0A0D1XES1_9EURO|nr:hypothetical protein PV11_02133 [Exophiala sideris]